MKPICLHRIQIPLLLERYPPNCIIPLLLPRMRIDTIPPVRSGGIDHLHSGVIMLREGGETC